jgi:hypothetical protein
MFTTAAGVGGTLFSAVHVEVSEEQQRRRTVKLRHVTLHWPVGGDTNRHPVEL